MFQTIAPVADDLLAIPAGLRRFFTHADVAATCGDLLAWRDAMFAREFPVEEFAAGQEAG